MDRIVLKMFIIRHVRSINIFGKPYLVECEIINNNYYYNVVTVFTNRGQTWKILIFLLYNFELYKENKSSCCVVVYQWFILFTIVRSISNATRHENKYSILLRGRCHLFKKIKCRVFRVIIFVVKCHHDAYYNIISCPCIDPKYQMKDIIFRTYIIILKFYAGVVLDSETPSHFNRYFF